ncbi:MAG: flavodoxin domain-containing protein [Gammaproteobacteria bacterium]
MAKILILYGTTEGQTRKIAERAAEIVGDSGHAVNVADGTSEVQPAGCYDAVIILASVHQGKHQASITHYVKSNFSMLERIPTAFLSVSLAAASPEPQGRTEAAKYMQDFLEQETGWTPDRSHCVAGALRYTRYDFFKRLIMRMLARHAGAQTDTTQDYEYTDWDDVTRFVEHFLSEVVESRVSVPQSRSN